MEISGVISAIVIGIIIGTLGRLVLPGRQRIRSGNPGGDRQCFGRGGLTR